MTTTLSLGAGALLANFTPTATTPAALRREITAALATHTLAETTGAGRFRAIPLVRNYHESARRTPAADATLLDGWNVTLSSHFQRMKPAALQTLLPWAWCDKVGKITTLTAPDSANGLRATPKLSWVGETSCGLALIDLHNAAHTGGLTLTFLPGDGGVAPFELRAHSGSFDAPFAIHFLER